MNQFPLRSVYLDPSNKVMSEVRDIRLTVVEIDDIEAIQLLVEGRGTTLQEAFQSSKGLDVKLLRKISLQQSAFNQTSLNANVLTAS